MWCAALALSLLGCEDTAEDPPGQRGELDKGMFYYLCAADSDAVCDSDAVVGRADEATGAFPPVAVGGDFKLNFVPDDASAVEYIDPGSESFITWEDTTFTAMLPGIVALVATDVSGYAVDLVHIRLAQPAAIRVSQTTTTAQSVDSFAAGLDINLDGSDVEIDLQGSVSLSGQIFLRAVPMDADDQILAGALATSWQSSDPSIVQIVSDPANNVIEVQPQASGTATLTVTMGQVNAAVTLQSGS